MANGGTKAELLVSLQEQFKNGTIERDDILVQLDEWDKTHSDEKEEGDDETGKQIAGATSVTGATVPAENLVSSSEEDISGGETITSNEINPLTTSKNGRFSITDSSPQVNLNEAGKNFYMTGMPSSFQTINLGLTNEEFWNVPLEKDFKKVEEFTTLDDYRDYLEKQVANGFNYDRANEIWSATTEGYGQTKDGQIVKYQDLPSDEEFEQVAQQQKSILTAQRGLPIGSQDLTNLTEAGFMYYQPESEKEREEILKVLSASPPTGLEGSSDGVFHSGSIPDNYIPLTDNEGNLVGAVGFASSGFTTSNNSYQQVLDYGGMQQEKVNVFHFTEDQLNNPDRYTGEFQYDKPAPLIFAPGENGSSNPNLGGVLLSTEYDMSIEKYNFLKKILTGSMKEVGPEYEQGSIYNTGAGGGEVQVTIRDGKVETMPYEVDEDPRKRGEENIELNLLIENAFPELKGVPVNSKEANELFVELINNPKYDRYRSMILQDIGNERFEARVDEELATGNYKSREGARKALVRQEESNLTKSLPSKEVPVKTWISNPNSKTGGYYKITYKKEPIDLDYLQQLETKYKNAVSEDERNKIRAEWSTYTTEFLGDAKDWRVREGMDQDTWLYDIRTGSFVRAQNVDGSSSTLFLRPEDAIRLEEQTSTDREDLGQLVVQRQEAVRATLEMMRYEMTALREDQSTWNQFLNVLGLNNRDQIIAEGGLIDRYLKTGNWEDFSKIQELKEAEKDYINAFPSLKLLINAVDQFQIANVAYKMNFDPLKLRADTFRDGHSEGWVNYSGRALKTGQEATIDWLDVVENSPELSAIYDDIAKNGFRNEEGEILTLEDLRTFADERRVGKTFAQFEQIALEFMVTRKLGGKSIEKLIKLLGTAPITKGGTGLVNVWSRITGKELKGGGTVSKAFTKLEAAILEEAGIITARNVAVSGVADGHYMSPVWAIGGVTFRLSNEFMTSLLATGGKAATKYPWYNQMLKSINSYNNRIRLGPILGPAQRRGYRQFIVGGFAGSAGMKAGDFGVDLMHIAKGELSFSDAFTRLIDSESFGENAGMILAMNLFTPHVPGIKAIKNYREDAASYRGQKEVFNRAARVLGGKNQFDFDYDPTDPNTNTQGEALRKIEKAKQEKLAGVKGGNRRGFTVINDLATKLGLSAAGMKNIMAYLKQQKVKEGKVSLADFEGLFKNTELSEKQRIELNKLVESINNSGMSFKSIFDMYDIELSANILKTKTEADSFLFTYKQSGMEKQIELYSSISEKLNLGLGKTKFTPEEAQALTNMSESVFAAFVRESIGIQDPAKAEQVVNEALKQYRYAKKAVLEANRNNLVSDSKVGLLEFREEFINSSITLSTLQDQLDVLERQDKEEGFSPFRTKQIAEVKRRIEELKEGQLLLADIGEQFRKKQFEENIELAKGDSKTLVFDNNEQITAWIESSNLPQEVKDQWEAVKDNQETSGFKVGEYKIINREGARNVGALSTAFHEKLEFGLDDVLEQEFENDADVQALYDEQSALLQERARLMRKRAAKEMKGEDVGEITKQIEIIESNLTTIAVDARYKSDQIAKDFVESFKRNLFDTSPEIYNRLEELVKDHPSYFNNKSTREWVTIFTEKLIDGEFDISNEGLAELQQLFTKGVEAELGGPTEFMRNEDIDVRAQNFIRLLLDYAYESRKGEGGKATDFFNQAESRQVEMAMADSRFVEEGFAFSASAIEQTKDKITELEQKREEVINQQKQMQAELGIAGIKGNPEYEGLVIKRKLYTEQINNANANIKKQEELETALDDSKRISQEIDTDLAQKTKYLDILARLEKAENPTDQLRNEALINELRLERDSYVASVSATKKRELDAANKRLIDANQGILGYAKAYFRQLDPSQKRGVTNEEFDLLVDQWFTNNAVKNWTPDKGQLSTYTWSSLLGPNWRAPKKGGNVPKPLKFESIMNMAVKGRDILTSEGEIIESKGTGFTEYDFGSNVGTTESGQRQVRYSKPIATTLFGETKGQELREDEVVTTAIDNSIKEGNLIDVNFNTFLGQNEAAVEKKIKEYISTYKGSSGRNAQASFLIENAPDIAEMLPPANMALTLEGLPKTQESLGLRNVMLELYENTGRAKAGETGGTKGAAGQVGVDKGKGTGVRVQAGSGPEGQIVSADILAWIGPEFLTGLDAEGNKIITRDNKNFKKGRQRYEALINYISKLEAAQRVDDRLTENMEDVYNRYNKPGVSNALMNRFVNNIGYNIRMGTLDFSAKVDKSGLSNADKFIVRLKDKLNTVGFDPTRMYEMGSDYMEAVRLNEFEPFKEKYGSDIYDIIESEIQTEGIRESQAQEREVTITSWKEDTDALFGTFIDQRGETQTITNNEGKSFDINLSTVREIASEIGSNVGDVSFTKQQAQDMGYPLSAATITGLRGKRIQKKLTDAGFDIEQLPEMVLDFESAVSSNDYTSFKKKYGNKVYDIVENSAKYRFRYVDNYSFELLNQLNGLREYMPSELTQGDLVALMGENYSTSGVGQGGGILIRNEKFENGKPTGEYDYLFEEGVIAGSHQVSTSTVGSKAGDAYAGIAKNAKGKFNIGSLEKYAKAQDKLLDPNISNVEKFNIVKETYKPEQLANRAKLYNAVKKQQQKWLYDSPNEKVFLERARALMFISSANTNTVKGDRQYIGGIEAVQFNAPGYIPGVSKKTAYYRSKLEHQKSSLEQSVFSNFLVLNNMWDQQIDYESGKAPMPFLGEALRFAESMEYKPTTWGELTQVDYKGVYNIDGWLAEIDIAGGKTNTSRDYRFWYNVESMKNSWTTESIFAGKPKTLYETMIDKLWSNNPFAETKFSAKDKRDYARGYWGTISNTSPKKAREFMENNPEVFVGVYANDPGLITQGKVTLENKERYEIATEENNNNTTNLLNEFNGKIKPVKTTNTVDGVEQAKIWSAAFSASNKLNRESNPKDITRVDLDQTLFKTNNITLFRSPVKDEFGAYEFKEVTADKFTTEGHALLDDGWVPDFSDYALMRDVEKFDTEAARRLEEIRDSGDFPTINIQGKEYVNLTGRVKVLTARDPIAAYSIQKSFMDVYGVYLDFAEVESGCLGRPGKKVEPEDKGLKLAEDYAEGATSLEFFDDDPAMVDMGESMFNQFDINGSSYLAKELKFSSQYSDFMKIQISQAHGGKVTSAIVGQEVTRQEALAAGEKNKKRLRLTTPGGLDARDLMVYENLPKGKDGEAVIQWWEENYFKPYEEGLTNINLETNNYNEAFKGIRQNYNKGESSKGLDENGNVIKLPKIQRVLKEKVNDSYYADHALRVYLWDKQGSNIPGISETARQQLLDYVNAPENSRLKAYAEDLFKLQKGELWPEPGENWITGSSQKDIWDYSRKGLRERYLEQWKEIDNAIFNEDVQNKLIAVHGQNYMEKVNSARDRMYTGRARPKNIDRVTGGFLNYLNGSIGTTLWVNGPVAFGQIVSITNTPISGKRSLFRKIKQASKGKEFFTEFKKTWNSENMKARLGQYQGELVDQEIENLWKESKGNVKKFFAGFQRLVISKIGNAPSKYTDAMVTGLLVTADRMAIKDYYLNMNNYNKKNFDGNVDFLLGKRNGFIDKYGEEEGLVKFEEFIDSEANTIAWTENKQTQQSLDPDKMTYDMTESTMGRLALQYNNTPRQYYGKMRKAYKRLKKGIGSPVKNVQEILYYGALNNLMYGAISGAVWSWDPDDEEAAFKGKKIDGEKKNMTDAKAFRWANGAITTILRGSGIYGAMIALVKDGVLKGYDIYEDQKGQWDKLPPTLLGVSPALKTKYTGIESAAKTMKYNNKEIMKEGFNSPKTIEASAKAIESIFNFPTYKAHQKVSRTLMVIEGEDAQGTPLDVIDQASLLMGYSPERIGLKSYVKKKKQRRRRPKAGPGNIMSPGKPKAGPGSITVP